MLLCRHPFAKAPTKGTKNELVVARSPIYWSLALKPQGSRGVNRRRCAPPSTCRDPTKWSKLELMLPSTSRDNIERNRANLARASIAKKLEWDLEEKLNRGHKLPSTCSQKLNLDHSIFQNNPTTVSSKSRYSCA